MTKKQENKISMLEGVHAYIAEHENITAANSGISMVNRDLRNKIDEIRNNENVRVNIFKGKTLAKNANRVDIINLGFAYVSKLFDYAVKSGNLELKSQSDFSRSEVSHIRDTELITKLLNISENVESNITALSPYGITQEKSDEFLQKINSFRNSLESTLTSQAIKVSVRKTIPALFKEANVILKSLDKMVEEYNKSDMQFYNGYKSARNIRNLGMRYKQTDELNPAKLPEVPGSEAGKSD